MAARSAYAPMIDAVVNGGLEPSVGAACADVAVDGTRRRRKPRPEPDGTRGVAVFRTVTKDYVPTNPTVDIACQAIGKHRGRSH
jgi:hypothetical protein